MLVDNLGQAVRTQLVDGLLADLLQAVRFCVCTTAATVVKSVKHKLPEPLPEPDCSQCKHGSPLGEGQCKKLLGV